MPETATSTAACWLGLRPMKPAGELAPAGRVARTLAGMAASSPLKVASASSRETVEACTWESAAPFAASAWSAAVVFDATSFVAAVTAPRAVSTVLCAVVKAVPSAPSAAVSASCAAVTAVVVRLRPLTRSVSVFVGSFDRSRPSAARMSAMLGSARFFTDTVLLPAALTLLTRDPTSTVPLRATGRPRTRTDPSESALAFAAAAGPAATLNTGLLTETTPARADGRTAALSNVGTLAGEFAEENVCSPYTLPSALTGVTTTFDVGVPVTVELDSATVPTRMSWPASARLSSVRPVEAVPAGGLAAAGAELTATAGPATPRTRAAAAAVARGRMRTGSSRGRDRSRVTAAETSPSRINGTVRLGHGS